MRDQAASKPHTSCHSIISKSPYRVLFLPFLGEHQRVLALLSRSYHDSSLSCDVAELVCADISSNQTTFLLDATRLSAVSHVLLASIELATIRSWMHWIKSLSI